MWEAANASASVARTDRILSDFEVIGRWSGFEIDLGHLCRECALSHPGTDGFSGRKLGGILQQFSGRIEDEGVAAIEDRDGRKRLELSGEAVEVGAIVQQKIAGDRAERIGTGFDIATHGAELGAEVVGSDAGGRAVKPAVEGPQMTALGVGQAKNQFVNALSTSSDQVAHSGKS